MILIKFEMPIRLTKLFQMLRMLGGQPRKDEAYFDVRRVRRRLPTTQQDIWGSLETESDSSFGEIIRTDLTLDVITGHYPDAVLTEFTRKVTNDFHVVFEGDAKGSTRKRFNHLPAHF